MVPDPETTCLGLEYFCAETDDLWKSSDEELKAIAVEDLLHLDLVQPEHFVDATVVREQKAYPVYNGEHKSALELVRRFVRETENLQLAGRNGLHRYNNQDHAMITGTLAAKNVCGANHDVWAVNADAVYLEDYTRSGTVAASG